MAEPPFESRDDPAKRLERRAYATYKSRLNAHKRLRVRGIAWNASLISLATSTTIAAVGLLSDPRLYGDRGPTLFTILAMLSLVASLVVTNMNYGGRSQSMETNYKRIQQIAISAEALSDSTHDVGLLDLGQLRREYEIALESSENHSDADFERTKDAGARRALIFRDELVSLAPYVSLAIPIVALMPLAFWLTGGK